MFLNLSKIIIAGFIIGIIIIASIHFFGTWEVRYEPPDRTAMNDKAVAYWLRCPFGLKHYFLVNGPTIADYVSSHSNISIAKLKACLQTSFDRHATLILIFGFGMSILIDVFSQAILLIKKWPKKTRHTK